MMMMPSIFGGNLFNDDWMDFSFPDIDKELYGKHAKNLMKTDVKEKDGNYEVAIDLPGFKKDEITAELKDGYLTISAAKGLDKDEKDKEGKYIRRERYAGNMSRSFYVGKDITEKDIHGKYENGILMLDIPKKAPEKKVEEKKFVTIGISKTADEKTIKKAYRKLAKKYHPDMNPGDKTAEQKFKEATDAYNILSDPEKRKLYDQYGHAAFDGTGAESEFYKNYQNYGGAHGGYQEFHFEGGDGDDIFGDIFGSMFGGGRNNKGFHRSSFHQGGFGSSDGFGGGGFGSGSFRQKGSDAHADISISFDEAVTGCDKVIHLQDQNGAMQSLQVHIPAGIDTGKSVRLRGKGNPGIGGGEAGDLFLKVTVGEKQGFERKGNDVYTTINVPFSTAVCGGEAVIKTLYGNVICKIKEGTQSGSKIRLRGKGMPLMKNPSQKGDQYAVVQIQVPRNVSQQAKNKLKEFEALCGQRGNASY